MTTLAALLLLAAAGGSPAGNPSGEATSTIGEHEAPAPGEATPVETRDDVARLCRILEPTERVRATGDAVRRGEVAVGHETLRASALKGRYTARLAPAKLAFAPYDGPERRLALQEPVQLPLAGGAARLWPTDHRDLAVEADAAAARRVLDAQRRGTLALEVVFDLPEDATCGTGARGKTFALGIDPVSWRWLDGDQAVAHGGAAAERPLVTAAQGAQPKIAVGDPISGPLDAKKLVLARAADLEGCYREALKRNPGVDGVLVADLGGARTAISADSVGDEDMAACVQKALAALVPGTRAAVPIRFELAPPGDASGGAR
jgi:hypothetical protein